MFGELLGAWLAERWQAMGAPTAVAPGRAGTRPRHLDGRRAARHARRAGLPCRDRPPSRRDQPSRCARCSARRSPASRRPGTRASTTCRPGRRCWSPTNSSTPLPVRQFEKTPRGWSRAHGRPGRRRRDAAPWRWRRASRLTPRMLPDARAGAQAEICEAGRALAAAIGARLRRDGGWALIVDYGYDRGGMAPRCRPSAAIAAPPSSTVPARPTSAPTSISPPSRGAAGSADRSGQSRKATSCAGWASMQRAETLKARADAGRARGHRRGIGALDRAGPNGHLVPRPGRGRRAEAPRRPAFRTP